MHASDLAWYSRCVATAVDHLEEFGNPMLYDVEPDHVEELRRLVRAEARRRRVKIRTYPGHTNVQVWAVEPSALAEAWVIVKRLDAELNPPRVDDPELASVRPWSRKAYAVDCTLPLVW